MLTIREYKKASILTPLLVSMEVVMECTIPFIIAQLVNQIKAGCEMGVILRYGGILVVMAGLSLTFGALAGSTCATASCGLARNLRKEDVGGEADFASIDVSFISLTKVLGPVKALMEPDGEVVCLIKPQFEAGREKVGKKGVVREKSVHLEVIEMVASFAGSIGFEALHLEFSPIKGPEGNIEYLLHLQNHGDDTPRPERPFVVSDVVTRAHDALDK